MRTDGVIHRGCNPLILLSLHADLGSPRISPEPGSDAVASPPRRPGFLWSVFLKSKHRKRRPPERTQPYKYSPSSPPPALPYWDGWAARPRSLRSSRQLASKGEAESSIMPRKARCLPNAAETGDGGSVTVRQRGRSAAAPPVSASMFTQGLLCVCVASRYRGPPFTLSPLVPRPSCPGRSSCSALNSRQWRLRPC